MVDALAEARAYREQIGTGLSQNEVARQAGVTPGLVSQRLALLRLHPGIVDALEQGTITLSTARECTRLSDEQQNELVEYDLLTYAAVHALVNAALPAAVLLDVEPPLVTLSRADVERALQGESVHLRVDGKYLSITIKEESG